MLVRLLWLISTGLWSLVTALFSAMWVLVNLRQSLRPMPWVNSVHVAERRPTGDFSPLLGYFVNLWQSLRPMPWVNCAHVAERRPMTGRPVGLEWQDRFYHCTFFDHFSLSPFLQVSPACKNANFYPDLEQFSLDSNGKFLNCYSIFVRQVCGLASP